MVSAANMALPQLRRASFDDMASVAALHRLSFFTAMPQMPVLHTPEEDVTFFSTIVFPRAEIWLSEQSGVAVGFIAFQEGWVEHLYVHPGHQGRGLGSALLALAQSQNHSLRLWTFQCNLPARRFYEGHDFRTERTTDGADTEERQPDILYLWTPNAIPKDAGANVCA